jgi:hypothetical protein
MTRIGVGVVMLATSLGVAGCSTYNPATGTYQPDPVGTSLVAGGLGLAGGVALGAALSDHDDCCWGGGGNTYVNNNYHRTNNYNYNKNVNRNVNRNAYRGNAAGRGRGGGYGGGRGGGRRRH